MLHFVNSEADTSFGQETEYYVQQPTLNFAHNFYF